MTVLVTTLLDEGLKTRRFPGIVFRDGPTGRRAGLVGGPDVWEVVDAIRRAPGKGEQRLRRVADDLGIDPKRLHLAVDFYAAYPREIEARIADNERAMRRLQKLVEQRERLLSR
jgi:hypothetical protein